MLSSPAVTLADVVPTSMSLPALVCRHSPPSLDQSPLDADVMLELNNNKIARLLALGFCLLALRTNALAEDEQPPQRRYDAGPLTFDDFQAPVPQPLPRVGRFVQLGKADTDIHFEYKYRYTRSPEGVETKLTDIEIFAAFMKDKSWLSQRDERALDHEQGHFDITQKFALEAMLEMKKRLADGKSLAGRGEDVPAALAELETKIRELLKPVYDRAATAQADYDRQTHNGISTAQQAEHRQRQIKVLEELNAQLVER